MSEDDTYVATRVVLGWDVDECVDFRAICRDCEGMAFYACWRHMRGIDIDVCNMRARQVSNSFWWFSCGTTCILTPLDEKWMGRVFFDPHCPRIEGRSR